MPEIQTFNLETKSLIHYPRTRSRHQTLATKKEENRCYAIANATVKFPNKRTLSMNTLFASKIRKKEGL